MTAPLLLTGARLPGAAGPVDVLLADGLVRAVGSEVGADGARRVDLAGRWIVPGLWDEHVHLTQWAMSRRRLDVSAATSAARAADLVRAHLLANPGSAGEHPVVGYGFRDGLWPDVPSRALLDAAGEDHAVVLVSADLHCVWPNSAAARLFGVLDGEDGLLVEDDAFLVTRRLDEVPDAVADGWVAEAADAAAARGVVGVVDLEMAWNPGVWARRVQAGHSALRVDTGVYTRHLDRALEAGLRSGDPVPGGAGLLRMGPFKILVDGSLNTRTACCREPYPDGTNGFLTVQPAELLALLRRAVGGGLTPAVHAIGDEAARVALDAFAELGVGGRMEHAQLVTAADLPRFAELGVTASIQPEHAMDDRDVADRHWAGLTARAFPARSLLDSGARLALGSDAPVSPLDPWLGIAAAVTRSRDGLAPWHPEQTISVADALAASTRHARIAPGEPADLVVLERDPLACSGDELRTMPVAATLLGGRVTAGTLPD